MQDLGARFEDLHRQFQAAIAWQREQPARASARLWDVLWTLAASEASSAKEQPTHPYILWAQQHIEAHLCGDLRASRIAEQLGCSADYLTRLFQRHLGTTLSRFVNSRRLLHAQELLAHTSLPINAVGAEVGLADPHVFNKFIRRLTGVAPKHLRQGSWPRKP